MTLNTIANSTAISLPPAYDGHGYSFHLYNGIVANARAFDGTGALDFLGRPNTAIEKEDYTYEILDNGVTMNAAALAAVGMEFDDAWELRSIDDEVLSISSDSSLANCTIKILSSADSDFWESASFTWEFKTATSLASLTTARNWNLPINPKWDILTYFCAAEDCEGRYGGGHSPATRAFQPQHYIPIRIGAGSGGNAPISIINNATALYTGNKDGTVKFTSKGYFPFFHITTDQIDLIGSGVTRVFGDNDGDCYIVHVIDDWKSLEEGLPHRQNSADGFSPFFNIKFLHPDSLITYLFQIQFNDGNFNFIMQPQNSNTEEWGGEWA